MSETAVDHLEAAREHIQAAEALLFGPGAEAVTEEHRERFLEVVAALNRLARPPIYEFPGATFLSTCGRKPPS